MVVQKWDDKQNIYILQLEILIKLPYLGLGECKLGPIMF